MGLWSHQAPRPTSTEFGTSADVPENRQKLLQWSLSCLPTDPKGFSGSSVSKESTCNTGDPSLIPGSEISPGEGTGYPLQYSWASLMAQLVKNPPTMWETWVQSLGWEDNPGEGKGTEVRSLIFSSSLCTSFTKIMISQLFSTDFHISVLSLFFPCPEIPLLPQLCQFSGRSTPMWLVDVRRHAIWDRGKG